MLPTRKKTAKCRSSIPDLCLRGRRPRASRPKKDAMERCPRAGRPLFRMVVRGRRNGLKKGRESAREKGEN